MFKNKFSIKENRKTVAAVAVTFLAVFGIKAGIGSFAKEQTPFNPRVSTISTSVVSQVQPYSVPSVYVEDAELYVGETVVKVQGSEGFKEEVMEVTTDGDQTKVVKVIETNIVKEAVASEIHIGTQEKPEYIYPVEEFNCTYGVGQREDGYHKGMDLLCPSYTEVHAIADGVVTHAGWMDGYGYCVFIDHGDGMESRCAHMNEVTVSVGDEVSQGNQIGWSGSTGDSECPHVHFEMRLNGDVQNPVADGYLPQP